jgi:hypothetical protein
VVQIVDGQEMRFLVDPNGQLAQVVEEYTPGGIVKVSYVRGNALISQNRRGAMSFYHVDGLVSTRALSDSSGLVTDRVLYDAFGRILRQKGSTRPIRTYSRASNAIPLHSWITGLSFGRSLAKVRDAIMHLASDDLQRGPPGDL